MAEKVKCGVCGEMFKDANGLEQHMAAKHPEAAKEKGIAIHHHDSKSEEKTPEIIDKSGGRYLIYGGIAIAVILGLIFYFSSDGNTSNDAFAQCLTEKGAVMYGAFWCPHCADQKKLFGSSMQYVSYIECSTPDGNSQLPICTSAGIQTYPTWKFADGTSVRAVMSLQQLSAKTGCALA